MVKLQSFTLRFIDLKTSDDCGCFVMSVRNVVFVVCGGVRKKIVVELRTFGSSFLLLLLVILTNNRLMVYRKRFNCHRRY